MRDEELRKQEEEHTTKTQQAIASQLRREVTTLNMALSKAAEYGIRVDLELHPISVMGGTRHEIINLNIYKEL
ncbi:MAG: hypothetical protein AB7C95_00795 [Synergistaceae bacterium]